jgi:hypothetical protein
VVQAVTIFTATHVSHQHLDDLDVTVLGVTDDSDGDGHSVIFQRSSTFTDQDRELGQDTFAVTTETGAIAYGGLESYDVGDDALVLEFEPAAADDLGLPTSTRVELALSRHDLDELRAGLAEVVDGDAAAA